MRRRGACSQLVHPPRVRPRLPFRGRRRKRTKAPSRFAARCTPRYSEEAETERGEGRRPRCGAHARDGRTGVRAPARSSRTGRGACSRFEAPGQRRDAIAPARGKKGRRPLSERPCPRRSGARRARSGPGPRSAREAGRFRARITRPGRNAPPPPRARRGRGCANGRDGGVLGRRGRCLPRARRPGTRGLRCEGGCAPSRTAATPGRAPSAKRLRPTHPRAGAAGRTSTVPHAMPRHLAAPRRGRRAGPRPDRAGRGRASGSCGGGTRPVPEGAKIARRALPGRKGVFGVAERIEPAAQSRAGSPRASAIHRSFGLGGGCGSEAGIRGGVAGPRTRRGSAFDPQSQRMRGKRRTLPPASSASLSRTLAARPR